MNRILLNGFYVTHLIVGQFLGLGDVDQRPQHFRKLHLIYHPIPVVVAHIENNAQLLVGGSFREQNNGVEKLLEGYPPVPVLIHDVEHPSHKHLVGFHPQRPSELLLGERGPHHNLRNVVGLGLRNALLAGLQFEGQSVGLPEEVLEPLLATLIRLGVCQHLLLESMQDLQLLGVLPQQHLQFVHELLPRSLRVELKHQVVIFGHPEQHHGLLPGVLRHFDREGVDALQGHRAQLFSLSVDCANFFLRPKLHFHQPLVILKK